MFNKILKAAVSVAVLPVSAAVDTVMLPARLMNGSEHLAPNMAGNIKAIEKNIAKVADSDTEQ